MFLSKLTPIMHYQLKAFSKNGLQLRSMSEHKVFPLAPSRWQWKKFKDLVHFYVMLGVIPLTVLVTGVNIFVGPATLTEIPEGYTPKYWEYYRHPITRFLAKYLMQNPQQEYEKYLSFLFMEYEQKQLRTVTEEVKNKIAERNDYQAYYYRPILAKYNRLSREAADYMDTIRGD